jgi:copper chaperone CopZ
MAQEFTVLDMTCGGCATSVRKAISRVPGVTAVDTAVTRNTVRVDAAENVSTDTLIDAINKAGYYEVTPVTSEPSRTDRWRESALEVTPSSTTSSGCGCCN